MLEKCKECGGQISNQATICPHCGFRRLQKIRKVIKISSFILLILAAVFFLNSRNSFFNELSLQTNPNISPPEQQFIAEQKGNNTYPPSAGKLKSIELGQAILMFMPPSETNQIDWSYQSTAGIIWLDDTYESAKDSSSNFRTGFMRINVEGIKSTILKKEVQELAWSVTYEGPINPRFGVDMITLEPGISDGNQCFGATTGNCTFNPLMSLAHANIEVNILCKSEVDGETVGLMLSAKGKKSIPAVLVTGSGSGGQSSSIALLVNKNADNLCK